MQPPLASIRFGLALLCILLSAAAQAVYVLPEYEQVPLDRLIKNLEARVAADPANVLAVLNLARTNAMAFSLKSDVATVFKGEPELGWQQASDSEHVPFDRPVETSDPAKRKLAARYLQAALKWYERAASLMPNDLIVRLGHAWLIERSGDKPRAIQMYRDLIARDWDRDPLSKRAPSQRQPAWSDSPVETVEILPDYPYYDSILPEATRYLIPLLDPIRDRDEIARLSSRAELVNSRPRPISPIAVPLRPGLQVTDLEDRSARVAFDADGSGQRKSWTWITSDAAWLVYQRPAQVGSALQLFGNFTFGLFWSNGYEPLAALDDDCNGALEAGELAALALWHDINGNGLSEDGEVQPLTSHRIVALSYQYRRDLRHADHIAYAPTGVTFADGSSRATYDLLLHPR